MAGDEQYNIGPQAKDIDFYIGGVVASAILTSEVSVNSSGTKIALASSSISSTASVSAQSSKIALTSIAFNATISANVASTEILKTLIHLDSALDVTATSEKIAYAIASISINSSVNQNLIRITNDSAHPAIATSVTASGQQVRLSGGISISGTSNVDFNPKEILFAQINILVKSRTIVNAPFRFSPNYTESSSIQTFLILDGKPLTDHNRTLDISTSPDFIQNTNWKGTKGRYYKRASVSGRKTFNISWKYLPNLMDYTVDTRHGRDYIASVATEMDSHTLKIVNQDQSGLTPYTEQTYTVFITSYNESMVRRYIDEGVYLYDCTLTLVEA
jgi:hypothetical protein